MKIIIITGVVLLLILTSFFLFNKNLTGNTINGYPNAPVKEFTMTSFYDNTGIWFSLKEIKVNKGDLVRLKVTNIKGTHDFTIDEYGIKKRTPLNEEVIIEFIADKEGSFEYYCSVTGHRQKGQWGTLRVLE
ncbi:MAG: cupredoxin domain-containing protein [archaeon]|nr:cupredoxin domain-containing protein [archaeon]